jgi:integrase
MRCSFGLLSHPGAACPRRAEDGLRRLLTVCAGKDLEARPDTAIITLLLDTGARSGELAGLTLSDVDFDLDVLLVLGKGRREGHCRSAERRPWRWTATCGRASVTRKPT